MRYLHLVLFVFLASCGSDKNDTSDEAPVAATNESQPPVSLAIQTTTELPACDEVTRQQLVYIMDIKQFQTCQDGAWVQIDVQGAPGKDGAAGAAGESGRDGIDNRIAVSGICITAATASLTIKYTVVEFTSGDVHAYGAVVGSVQQIGAPSYYSGQQVGAELGSVIFVDDYETTPESAWWHIELNRTTKTGTATYNNSAGALEFDIVPADCTFHEFS